MKNIATLLLLSSIVGQVISECIYNTRCNGVRGTINQSGSRVSLLERTLSRHRWWIIEPSNAKGTVLLAFKNFRSTNSQRVTVHVHKRNGARETRIFSGAQGNFEIIETDAWNVTINATVGFGKNTNFTLHFYGDCEVTQQNPIVYPDDVRHTKKQTTCFIIAPQIQDNVNRVYFTLRNIWLPEGVGIKMTDVHTSEVISLIEDVQDPVNVAVESKTVNGGINSYYVMLELTCSSKLCDHTQAAYLASHHVMNKHDIWCIEAQKLCHKKKQSGPRAWCDKACPALDAMSEQEYMFESRLLQTHVEDTTVVVETQTVQSSAPARKRKLRCPDILPQRNCRCDRDPKDDRDFCDPKRKCIKVAVVRSSAVGEIFFEKGDSDALNTLKEKGCLWRCIVTKFTKCINIRRFAPLVLL